MGGGGGGSVLRTVADIPRDGQQTWGCGGAASVSLFFHPVPHVRAPNTRPDPTASSGEERETGSSRPGTKASSARGRPQPVCTPSTVHPPFTHLAQIRTSLIDSTYRRSESGPSPKPHHTSTAPRRTANFDQPQQTMPIMGTVRPLRSGSRQNV